MASTTCAHCGRLTHMTIYGDVISRKSEWATDDVYYVQAAFICDNCYRMSVALGTTHGDPHSYARSRGDEERWTTYADVQWYPRIGVSREFPDVPSHIAQAASEAYSCQSIGAHRAAVLLSRSVIEATAKDKGITSGQLFSKIEQMYEKGHVREHIKDAAHEVRHLGNDTAHGDFVEPVSAEEADEVLELMAEVLNEVFQSPARVAARKAARLAKGQPPA